MIVAFWILTSALLDSPERRIRMEVKRMTEILKAYNDAKKTE